MAVKTLNSLNNSIQITRRLLLKCPDKKSSLGNKTSFNLLKAHSYNHSREFSPACSDQKHKLLVYKT